MTSTSMNQAIATHVLRRAKTQQRDPADCVWVGDVISAFLLSPEYIQAREHGVAVLIKSSLDLASEVDGLKATANIPQEEKARILAIVERTYDAYEQLGEVIISDTEPHQPTASCAPSFSDVSGKYAEARN